MDPESEILERWIEKLADLDGQPAALRAVRPDPFRNPVGYAIRKSLAQLWEELRGDMNSDAIDSALDAILRIRAVQDMSPSQAIGFVSPLQSVVREAPAAFDLALLENRIHQLTLAAFDKYMQCRDQLRALRWHEKERLTRPHRIAGKAGA